MSLFFKVCACVCVNIYTYIYIVSHILEAVMCHLQGREGWYKNRLTACILFQLNNQGVVRLIWLSHFLREQPETVL